MANPLYQMMGNNQGGFMQRLQQFRQNFKGNPDEAIQQMLSSGKVSQQQYNQAVEMARQFQRMMGR